MPSTTDLSPLAPMPLPGPLDKRTLHALAIALLATAVLAPTPATAQSGNRPAGAGFANSPASRPAADTPAPRRRAQGLSELATDEVVAEIRVRGNKTVPSDRITNQMQTRVGRPFDPRALQADMRRLNELPYFVSVRPRQKSTPAGLVIELEVTERRTLRYVDYLGNDHVSDKKLAETTFLKVGGAIDPYAVAEGRRKIEAYYQEKGFGRVHVEVLEGEKTGDRGVIYSIHEGPKTRVWSVQFEGNTFASDGQLRNKIQTKPGFTRFFGFFNSLSEEELDADVDAITSYYRSFGYFRARVGRSIEYDDDGEWATIRFAVQEGPRYKVRNVVLNGVDVFREPDMREGLRLGKDDQFEQTRLSADVKFLQDLYGSRGYIFADVRPETVFLEAPGQIDLVYNIEEGERWRVGNVEVNIRGESAHTRIPVALNRFTLQPGDILDTRKLRDSELRLRRARIFNTSPATGSPPEITYRISEQTKQWLAERERAKEEEKRGVFRGQNPGAAAYPPTNSYPPTSPAPPAYPPAGSTGWQPAAQATPQAPAPIPRSSAYQVQPAGTPTPQYGGTAIAPAGPYDAPYPSATTPVNQLNPQAGVRPTQFVQPPPPGAPIASPYPPAAGGYPPLGDGPPIAGTLPTEVYGQRLAVPPNDPRADVIINLEETQTGRFTVGAAINSDAGLVGQILIDEQNFDWRAFPRSYRDFYEGRAFRGGGQHFRLEAAPGTQVQRYLASWQEPYLFDTPISLSLSGSLFDRRFDDWDEQRLGGRIGFGYQWVDRDLSASFNYRGESIDVRNVIDLSVPELAEMNGENELHGFGIRLVTDKRDNPFLATEGFYLSTTFEQVIGSFDYPRVEIDARTYMLLRERPDHTGRHVASYSTRVGFTGSNTPTYDRFFAGGFSTLRGYDFRGVTPVAGVLNSDIGGDFMWINSLEYLFPITADDAVSGVVFVDHGTVNEDVTLDDYRVAPGVGLRIAVPALGPAPIALDFAWSVAGADTDEDRVFTFSMGLQR